MSVGNNLQEMEVSTKKSVSAVNKGAKPGESMNKANIPGEGLNSSVEDLGGPTPTNSRPDDESNKIKTPGRTLAKVSNVVNKGAKAPDPMQHANKAAMSYEETEVEDGDLVLDESEGMEVEDDEEQITEEEISFEDKLDQITNQEIDYTDDISALMNEENLSEETLNKAKTIFEAAVNQKVISLRQAFQEQYEKALVEEVTEIKEQLTDRIDSYLEYVSEEWMLDNALQIESGIKSELSESFMQGLKGLFEDHYVEIPEDKYNVLESMVERLDEMEGKLNEQIDRNVQLNRRLSESVSGNIFNDVSEGLALTQKEKFASLAEGVEFESEEKYREKLETIKESYFVRTADYSSKGEILNEQTEDYGPQMNAYLRALGKYTH